MTKAVRTEQAWFPMRVTYQRELKVKTALDEIGVENFLPMKSVLSEAGGHRHYAVVPAVSNLIFLHETFDRIAELKRSYTELMPLRFIMTRPVDRTRPEAITVSDHKMTDFIRIASHTDDSVMFLNVSDVEGKEGRKVLVTAGEFAGVEGVVKRVQKNRRVVVQLGDLAAVAISFTPPVYLKYI